MMTTTNEIEVYDPKQAENEEVEYKPLKDRLVIQTCPFHEKWIVLKYKNLEVALECDELGIALENVMALQDARAEAFEADDLRELSRKVEKHVERNL